MLKTFLNLKPTLWLILSIPALALLVQTATGSMDAHFALHPTGETAARLMILALMISPLRTIWPHAYWLYWLLRRRRGIGVAAFFHASLHLIFYLESAGSLGKVASDLAEAGIWTGWMAMLVFVPLAATSNDTAVRWLGRWWKPLQRTTYATAMLTVLHWSLVSHGIGGVIVHFAPLALLEAWRIFSSLKTAQASGTSAPAR